MNPSGKIDSLGKIWLPRKVDSHGENWLPREKLAPSGKIDSLRKICLPREKLTPSVNVDFLRKNWIPREKLNSLETSVPGAFKLNHLLTISPIWFQKFLRNSRPSKIRRDVMHVNDKNLISLPLFPDWLPFSLIKIIIQFPFPGLWFPGPENRCRDVSQYLWSTRNVVSVEEAKKMTKLPWARNLCQIRLKWGFCIFVCYVFPCLPHSTSREGFSANEIQWQMVNRLTESCAMR